MSSLGTLGAGLRGGEIEVELEYQLDIVEFSGEKGEKLTSEKAAR